MDKFLIREEKRSEFNQNAQQILLPNLRNQTDYLRRNCLKMESDLILAVGTVSPGIEKLMDTVEISSRL
jgi:hypothetical protein